MLFSPAQKARRQIEEVAVQPPWLTAHGPSVDLLPVDAKRTTRSSADSGRRACWDRVELELLAKGPPGFRSLPKVPSAEKRTRCRWLDPDPVAAPANSRGVRCCHRQLPLITLSVVDVSHDVSIDWFRGRQSRPRDANWASKTWRIDEPGHKRYKPVDLGSQTGVWRGLEGIRHQVLGVSDDGVRASPGGGWVREGARVVGKASLERSCRCRSRPSPKRFRMCPMIALVRAPVCLPACY